ARRGTTVERPERRFELCRGEPRGRAHAEHPIELALRGYRRLDPLDLILEPPQLVERRRAAPSAEPFRASPCACLADLRGERGLACGDFLDLALHALELGLHLKRSAALLGAQCFGAIALRDDPLLLGERLARERLVASREGELRAALPSPGLGVELLDLAAKLLLGGDGAHHPATRRAQLLLHLVDDVRDGASRVLDAIAQCIEVARDDAAHAIEDPHGTRECATPGWRGPPSGPAPSLFSAYPPPGSPRPPLPRLSPLCDGRRATGVRCASAIERPAPHPLWNPLLA